MSLVRAQFALHFSKEMIIVLIACMALAALWAGFRPEMVRDNDGRRLPPSVTARLTFVVLFVVAYLGVTALVHFIPYLVSKLGTVAGLLGNIVAKDSVPIYGLLVVFGLYSIPPFREVERTLLAWMHSTSHLRSDMQLLTNHLQDCGFELTSDEQRRNLHRLEELGVYVTDGDTSRINLESVVTWRKTTSLLRLVREWNAEEPRVLTQEDMAAMEDIAQAHSRKTGLAVEIIRLLESMRESDAPSMTLSAVTDILGKISHGNRQGVDELEAKAQAKLENPAVSATDRSVRLSSSELQEHLTKIEDYFHVEYRLLLERITKLAAKSVLHAGDAAADRLDELKARGFQNLGAIRPISTNRILWMFLSVAFGGFLIYYVLWFPALLRRLTDLGITDPAAREMQARTFLIGITVFVTSLAFAAMVGALFGSSSLHARAKDTPWGRYLVAGIVATVGFFFLQMVREFVILGLQLTTAPLTQVDPVTRMMGVVPWFILPFLVAFAICWLARQSHWHSPLGLNLGNGVTATFERVVDGIVLGVIMLPGYAIAVGLTELIVGRLPPIFISRFDVPIIAILAIVGFFIGALVVRDVRSAAHAQVVIREGGRNRSVNVEKPIAAPSLALRPGE